MKKRNRIVALLFICLMTAALTGCSAKEPAEGNTKAPRAEDASETAEQETGGEEKPGEVWVLKVGTTSGATANQAVFAENFGKHLSELSGGTMAVEVYPSASLGNTAQLFSQLSEGTLDIFSSGMDTATALKDAGDFGIFSMPYAFDDCDHMRAFTQTDTFAGMNQKLIDANGVQFGGILGSLSPRGLSSNKPVAAPSDLANMKIRVPESTANMAVWAAWGANPVTIAWTETYTSLESGIADGQDNSLPDTYISSICEVNKYYTELSYIQQCVAFWVSTKTWNSMTEEQQGWFAQAVALADAENSAAVETVYEENKNLAVSKQNVTIVDFDKGAFQALAAEAVEEFDGKLFSGGLYDYVRSLAE